jgi:hypothetical protein
MTILPIIGPFIIDVMTSSRVSAPGALLEFDVEADRFRVVVQIHESFLTEIPIKKRVVDGFAAPACARPRSVSCPARRTAVAQDAGK